MQNESGSSLPSRRVPRERRSVSTLSCATHRAVLSCLVLSCPSGSLVLFVVDFLCAVCAGQHSHFAFSSCYPSTIDAGVHGARCERLFVSVRSPSNLPCDRAMDGTADIMGVTPTKNQNDRSIDSVGGVACGGAFLTPATPWRHREPTHADSKL